MFIQQLRHFFLLLVVVGMLFSAVLAWAGENNNKLLQQIERDVSANIPVRTIIKKAMMSGIDLTDVIAGLTEVTANPSLVVYTAISEGYPAQEVVAAALRANASLGSVVNAAVVVGADTQLIAKGAVEAGASPAAVATAISVATAPKAPVYGSAIFVDDRHDKDQEYDRLAPVQPHYKHADLYETKHASPSHPPHPPHPEHPNK